MKKKNILEFDKYFSGIFSLKLAISKLGKKKEKKSIKVN